MARKKNKKAAPRSGQAKPATVSVTVSEKMEAKKEAILDAALSLFASKGFDGTPVGELAEKAGVAAGTIYRYFSGKEALVNGLYLHWKRKFLAAMQTDFPAGSAVREQFMWFWYALVRFEKENSEAFSFLEMHYHATYLDQESLKIEEEVLELFRTYIANGQRQQAIKAIAPDLLIALVFGAFTNMIKQQCGDRFELTDAILADAERACWDLVAN